MTRYVLDERYAFRGYKGVPYGILDRAKGSSFFLTEPAYALAVNCNGRVDIDMDILPPVAQKMYEEWLQGGYIHVAEEGEEIYPFQEYRYYNSRYKETVHWSITGKCNYRCKHCFMSAPHALQGEPGFEDCIKMLESFERCGIQNVHLTGGEPLIRRDFWNIVDAVHDHNMGVQAIYTNGRLFNEEFVGNLRKRFMNPMIQFSFDGVGTHDWMRGVKGAEEDAIKAFKLCQKYGIGYGCSMSLCKDNAPAIRDTVRLLAELGCSNLKIGTCYAQGEWLNQPEHFLSQAETYQAFLDYIPQYFEDGCPMDIGLEGFFNYDRSGQNDKSMFSANEKDVPDDAFGRVMMCGHVRKNMYVSPIGNVLPCMSMIGMPIESQFPNMLETPLEEILDKSLYMHIVSFSIKDFMEHNPDCAACEYKNKCVGGCRAFAIRTTPDDYLGKDMWTCEYFKGGWMDKKNKLLEEMKEKYPDKFS
ncbi:MAG: radical SAM protein [Clostridiales bacterium]|nr:radical SAM protein [Clostridiales bacterium]